VRYQLPAVTSCNISTTAALLGSWVAPSDKRVPLAIAKTCGGFLTEDHICVFQQAALMFKTHKNTPKSDVLFKMLYCNISIC